MGQRDCRAEPNALWPKEIMASAKELRGLLEGERQAQKNRRRPRFTAEVKKAVIQYVMAARARGATEAQLLEELGIGPGTLIRWCGRKGQDAKFRRMSIVQDSHASAAGIEAMTTPSLSLGRRGVVAIIGLSVPELAELLGRLGC